MRAFLASLALGLPFVAMGVYQLKTKTGIIMPEIRKGDETGISAGIMCLVGGLGINLINFVRLVYKNVQPSFMSDVPSIDPPRRAILAANTADGI